MATYQVKNVYGARSGRPLVSIEAPSSGELMVTPAEARALAWNLLAAAESAEQDGFVVEFARSHGSDPADTLRSFRDFRDAERARARREGREGA